MTPRIVRSLGFAVAATVALNAGGCGWALYPERRGQTSGRVDPAVAIMDGLGLLLFIVPGVIAFAVDFSSGAIYLPEGASRRRGKKRTGLDVLAVAPRDLSPGRLETVIERETGVPDTLRHPDLRIVPIRSPRDLDFDIHDLRPVQAG